MHHHTRRKKKEEIVAWKQFTEIINETASDDDLPYTDSGSTSLASVDKVMLFDDTAEP